MFNFWETKFGKDLDGNISQIRLWMKAMLVVSSITAFISLVTVIVTAKKSK